MSKSRTTHPLKPRHYVLLAIVCENSGAAPHDGYMIFDNGDTRLGKWCEALHAHTVVNGSDGAMLGSLLRRGLIVRAGPPDMYRYAFRLTEAGREVYTEWKKTLPTSVKELREYVKL